MSASGLNCKIIKPNNTKKERIKDDKYRYHELNDLIRGLFQIEKKKLNIQKQK